MYVNSMTCIYPRDVYGGLLEFLTLVENHYSRDYNDLNVHIMRRWLPSFIRHSDIKTLIIGLFTTHCCCHRRHDSKYGYFELLDSAPNYRSRAEPIFGCLLATLQASSDNIVIPAQYIREHKSLVKELFVWFKRRDFYRDLL